MTKPGHAVIKLSAPETGEFWPIPVLWEDARLLALDKPSGLLTSPDRYDPKRANLVTLLHRGIARGASWAQERQLDYLANANRLDFETRSEEHTSELQSRLHLVCRLLLEKKKTI